MSRLKHPVRAIREPFGTAGLIVAMIALVAALGGSALAATKLNSTQKKEVEKIAKKFAGKPGVAGANGVPGAKGDAGGSGANGAPGAAGTSVTGTPVSAGQEGCAAGGVKYTSASGTNVVCNGKNGTNGTTGFTETLPEGETETGAFFVPESEVEFIPLSFPIPLQAGATVSGHFVKASESPPSACAGGTPTAPTAKPGNLCVFQSAEFASGIVVGTSFIDANFLSSPQGPGAIMEIDFESSPGVPGPGFAVGSWAVTAPE